MIPHFKRHAISAAIALACTAPALAQDNDEAVARKATDKDTVKQQKANYQAPEKITVTGSRLRRDSFSVATPLVTMDKDAISDTGLGSLSEILIDNMPAIHEGSSNSTTQSSVTATGLSTIDLRGLGTSRTLTLIDGRRVVSNSHSGSYVSLSTIPAGMVQKVETITGGASAAYGSDAIAGVVNIITQKDKEGFSANVRVGESADGGGKENSLDLSFGTSFSDERGYVFASASYDRQHGLFASDRKRAQVADAYTYDDEKMCNAMWTTSGEYACMRDLEDGQTSWVNLSDGTAGGVFGEDSSNDTQFWYDESGLRDDWKGNEEIYGVNSTQWVALKVPDEALVAAVKVDYDLNDDIASYFQVQFSQNKSLNKKSPEDIYEREKGAAYDSNGEPFDVRLDYMTWDNPYIPEAMKPHQELWEKNGRIYFDRRLHEVGQVTTDNTRTTIRSWAGLQGTLFDGDWDWDVSVGYGTFKQEQLRLNEINVAKLNSALKAEYAEDGVTIQCKEAEARADGCVPVNLFGIGSISEEAADYIRHNATLDSDLTQFNVLGYIAGDLFELPAGPVSAVFGAEYRRDTQSVETDEISKTGGISFNYIPSYSGEVEVSEIFAEFAFPLLKDSFAAKNLSAEVSVRAADYSMEQVGNVGSYKAGIIWEPVEGYALRTNYSVAQRAPNIKELLSPIAGDYDTIADICKDTTADSTKPGHDNCRKDSGIQATIDSDEDGIFNLPDTGYSPSAGNDQLFEETGTTFTFGMTFAPTQLEGFRLAIDYFDIEIEDVITTLSNEQILSGCYNPPTGVEYGIGNQYCNAITRDGEGRLTEVVQTYFNADMMATRGYDVAAEYAFDLNELGSLKLKAHYTHLLEDSTTKEVNGALETTDTLGYRSYSFEDVASASATWRLDDLRIRWSTKFKGSVKDSLARETSYQGYLESNAEECASATDKCVENPEPLAFQDIGSYIKHSVSASYMVDLEGDASVRIYGGVNNIFDNNGPFIISGKGNYSSVYGGGVGRFFYLGAEAKF
ncbi:TonB-dependent receptor domain-containing protein [Psychrobium sp. 1_MG-2023]|uniref:TonB-dependent receptor domain-containing protein n=1 Tax=Psychrobium sp. 1_MG-2023 TaxID=3062624 RepID=UPI0026CF35EA|nr:TonB-dependent receptor [Psychrobium sp. 1_MG-2023]MDP2559695.1 TonB-dependent receptor [Psychrobium sp. 1_MG-2023]